MMKRVFRPPRYAWDWFARQGLLWQETRRRLAVGKHPSAAAYRTAETKSEVLTLLQTAYPHEEAVRAVVKSVITELAFLGRTDVPFDQLGVRAAPRGMRWWWTVLTGEVVHRIEPERVPDRPVQLSLEDVREGFGS